MCSQKSLKIIVLITYCIGTLAKILIGKDSRQPQIFSIEINFKIKETKIIKEQ